MLRLCHGAAVIEYGITTSKAHVWAHLCPLDGCFYWYKRSRMVFVCEKYERKTIPTAMGHIVPVVKNLRANNGFIWYFGFPYEWLDSYDISSADSDRTAGTETERLFEFCVKAGLFLVPLAVDRKYLELREQFDGKDYRCSFGNGFLDVEIKLDARGGRWGTGNLFVQTHELNHDHARRSGHRKDHS